MIVSHEQSTSVILRLSTFEDGRGTGSVEVLTDTDQPHCRIVSILDHV
jgi:hypothetical protein